MSHLPQTDHDSSTAASRFRSIAYYRGRGKRDRAQGVVALLAGATLAASLAAMGGDMTRVGRKAIIAGSTALVSAVAAGVATASILPSSSRVDSSALIHGCWTNAEKHGSHTFVLLKAGASCPKGTTAVS